MPTLVCSPERRDPPGRIAAGARFALTVAPGILTWVVMIGLGTAGFSAQVRAEPFDILREEVLGFAGAFAVAGTITGFAAAATSGRRRWSIAFAATCMILLAASAAVLRWWIFRFTAPNVSWGRRVWHSAIGVMESSALPSIVSGLAISGLVLVASLVECSLERWKFGLIVAVVVAMLGMVVLPMAVSHLSDLIVLYAGPNYRYLYDNLMAGTAIGAGTGALVGAVVVGMIARFFTAVDRRRGQQPGDAAPPRDGGPDA